MKIRPQRDATGQIIRPAYVWLNTSAQISPPALLDRQHAVLLPAVLTEDLTLATLTVGENLRVLDARHSSRKLTIEAITDTAVLVSANKTVYWTTGAPVLTSNKVKVLAIGSLPAQEQALHLELDDTLKLTADMSAQPVPDSGPYTIGCSAPEIFDQVQQDERVWFDDGKIGARVTYRSDRELGLRVTRVRSGGAKLRAEKGINFPDTKLRIPALTDEDRQNLKVVAQHADMINMSFVSRAQDIADLISPLEEFGAEEVSMVLKIETVAAFRSLPELLLEAMQWPGVGVMIARGDLAVEAGFERMAELQEEILWLCEAAHVPVIWATQVLETMAKSGLPSRSEVTDAAMAQRAEAVMLNKGPFIRETIAALRDILSRMDGHSAKKRDMLRALHSWQLDGNQANTD